LLRGYENMPTGNGLETLYTPLVSTIIASREIIDKFKADTRVDIVNVIYLTDGMGAKGAAAQDHYASKVIVTDPKTKKQMILGDNPQHSITAFVREITGCRHIGFYICNANNFGHSIQSLTAGRMDLSATPIDFAAAHKKGYVVMPMAGFDNFYCVIDTHISATEDRKLKGAKYDNFRTDAIAFDFQEIQAEKKAKRFILGMFAKEIAKN
jgi:hypothetical protein